MSYINRYGSKRSALDTTPYYTQAYSSFINTGGSWATATLPGCPPNVVADVLMVNNLDTFPQVGGVREVGSSLPRSFGLVKGEPGWHGASARMYVNTNSSSQVQLVGVAGVTYVVLGWWTNVIYIEDSTIISIGSAVDNMWIHSNLISPNPWSGNPDSIYQFALGNTNTANMFMGVRRTSAGNDRRLDLPRCWTTANSSCNWRTFPCLSDGSGNVTFFQERGYDLSNGGTIRSLGYFEPHPQVTFVDAWLMGYYSMSTWTYRPEIAPGGTPGRVYELGIDHNSDPGLRIGLRERYSTTDRAFNVGGPYAIGEYGWDAAVNGEPGAEAYANGAPARVVRYGYWQIAS